MNNKTFLKITKYQQIELYINDLAKKAIREAYKLNISPQKALFYLAEQQKELNKLIDLKLTELYYE